MREAGIGGIDRRVHPWTIGRRSFYDEVEEVRGLAVVGHQPVLKPGEQFEYTSWTRIATPRGRMHGTFFCITEDAHWFEAPVQEFALADTSALH